MRYNFDMKNKTSTIYISKENLLQNSRFFSSILNEKTKLCVVLKANAYGHGIQEVGRIAQDDENVDFIAVNYISEAVTLRTIGVRKRILVLIEDVFEYYDGIESLDIEIVLSSYALLEYLAEKKIQAKLHLKVDTGMGRLGFLAEDLEHVCQRLKKVVNVELVGVMSHFSNVEDVSNQDYAELQYVEFHKCLSIISDYYDKKKLLKHISASAGAMLLPYAQCDMVRIGISYYGLWPSEVTKNSFESLHRTSLSLKPVLSWYSYVSLIKEIPENSFIGYGCTYKTGRKSRIAVIPVGYYEGISRLLSNKGHVLIRGQYAPIIGRVCMHMIMVDVTDFSEIDQFEEVILIGNSGQKKITADDIAVKSDTIGYEVVTSINQTLIRKVKD